MGYSQRAAVLTTPKRTYLNISTRSLTFVYNPDQGYYNDKPIVYALLMFEHRYGGILFNPILFNKQLEIFRDKVLSFKNVPKRMIVVQIAFSMSKEEEFFADNIYRIGQKKLFDRLTDKADKAVEKFNEESVLLCVSGIADYVSLFK